MEEACIKQHWDERLVRMINTTVTPNGKVTGENGGVAGVVLLMPAFFAQFPDVRFHFADRDRNRKRETNPVIYKYGAGALEEVVEA